MSSKQISLSCQDCISTLDIYYCNCFHTLWICLLWCSINSWCRLKISKFILCHHSSQRMSGALCYTRLHQILKIIYRIFYTLENWFLCLWDFFFLSCKFWMVRGIFSWLIGYIFTVHDVLSSFTTKNWHQILFCCFSTLSVSPSQSYSLHLLSFDMSLCSSILVLLHLSACLFVLFLCLIWFPWFPMALFVIKSCIFKPQVVGAVLGSDV